MVTKRGQQDVAKPAAAAQGVAPVPPEGQTQTPPQKDLGGERLPELTREAYEAVVAANTDLSQRLADALGAVEELNRTVADLTAKLGEALTRATTAEGRERAALDVIDRLNATNAEQAVEPAVDLSSTMTIADAARRAGVPVEELLGFRFHDDELVVVTRAGHKIRKPL